MNTISVIVDAMERQGEGNLAVRLVAADQANLPPFEAGAHIDLHLPNGLIRPYSLAGSPSDTSHYLLCIKQADDSRGGSKYIHQQLRVGQAVSISAPRNLFQLLPAPAYILIAGGIGITPLLSMAETITAKQQPFSLFYYTQKADQIAFKKYLSNSHFSKNIVFCQSENGQSPRHWQPEALKQWDGQSRLYLCGPIGMMTNFKSIALSSGWPESHIHFEAFAATKPAIENQKQERFTVEIASTGKTYEIPPERSIASVLLEAGEPIALSCEMGMCGACLTKVLSGTPDHQDSVQTDDDKNQAQPLMALCCSRSHSTHLRLDL